MANIPDKPSLDAPDRPNGIYAIRFRNTKAGPRDKRGRIHLARGAEPRLHRQRH